MQPFCAERRCIAVLDVSISSLHFSAQHERDDHMIPSIPLPFVVAILLTILLMRALFQRGRILRPATVFIAACIFLVVTVGLRWTADLQWVRFLQPVVAALLPLIAWFCFSELRGSHRQRYWPHLLATAAILILSALWQYWQTPIDLILALLYFTYAALLAHQSYASGGNFENARLAEARGARSAAFAVAGLLLTSGIIDLVIAADFEFYRGSHAASIVGAAHMLTLPLVAFAIAVMGRSVPDNDVSLPNEANKIPALASEGAPTGDHRRILEALDTAMSERRLFRDPDLTLRRLSRKLAIPARQISVAINRTSSRNVSQVVNEYRVREAMRLLNETDLSITAAMMESGFQTKSNFNREFLRVTGMTPREYRQENSALESVGGLMGRPEGPPPENR